MIREELPQNPHYAEWIGGGDGSVATDRLGQFVEQRRFLTHFQFIA